MSALVRIASRTCRPLRKRDLLLLSCAVAAVGVAAPREARAQGFQGTETVVSGVAGRTITGSTSELITVGSSHATIDWSPFDNQGTGTIDFLPSGHSATFTNDPQLTGNYIVLNRIVPADASRPIALNGTIVSQIQDASQNTGRGGSVWFYSPGGIMVGATAVIDVGGLVLTTNDVTSFGSTSDFTGIDATFAGSSTSNAAVHIQSGAQVSALANNSYLAVVAPRVIQDGTVRVDGSVAYVAAQAATLSVNHGLFDIQVDVGTDDAHGILHTGTTGGPSSTGAGDNHGIYMVAVPKNQVLATFLTGNVGFDAASSASVENGVIVLSAGYNVSGSAAQAGDLLFSGGGDDGADPLGSGTASFHIEAGHYSSDVIGRAGQHIYSSGLNGSTVYDGDVTLIGRVAAHINARNGNDITVAGNATVTNGMSSGYRDRSSQGAQALFNAESGSTLTIGGNAVIDAGVVADTGQSATGGTAGIYTNGGTISIGGDVTVDASAFAGLAAAGQAGASGTGGTAQISTGTGGSLTIGGFTELSSVGMGGSATGGQAAGDGQGGRVFVSAIGGDMTINDILVVSADGMGGSSAGGAGGDGVGGLASVFVDNATLRYESAFIDSLGVGGSGATGGLGAGGYPSDTSENVPADAGAIVGVRNGAIIGSSLRVSSAGHGGAGLAGAGGAGVGGLSSAIAYNGTAASLIDVDSVTVTAVGTGGTGSAGAAGGIGSGGVARLLANAIHGTLVVETATIEATGIGGTGGAAVSGGAGGAGGAGYGGFTNYGTASGANTGPDRNGTATFGSVDVDVSGFGGAGGSGNGAGAGGAGGVGIGGTATLLARGSRVEVASVDVLAQGTGGFGGMSGDGAVRATSGTGVGGAAGVLATNIFQGTTPASVSIGTFNADASGIAVTAGADTQAGGVSIVASSAEVEIGSVDAVANGAVPRDISGTDAFGDPFTLTPVISGITATNATVQVTGDADFTTGGSIEVTSNTGGTVSVGDDLTLAATDGVNVTAADGGEIAVAGTLSATSGTGATGESSSVNIATIATEGGTPGAAGIRVGQLSVSSAEDVEILGVEASGSVNVLYNDDVELGELAANAINVRLGSALDPTAEGYTAEISGLVSAPTILIESGDLVIEDGGQLGEAGVTTSLELIARSFGEPILVGGSDLPVDENETGQYVLSQADAERIEASAITFRATSSSQQQAPQVIVRDLTIQGSAGEGTSSVLLTTAGSVRVEGDVAYIDAAADDALRIFAGERLEVITPDGSIRMVDSDGNLAGMLTLQSPHLVVADAALAAQLAEDPNFSGRETALATNNGSVNEAGYLQSGGMQLLTSGNIFIQNTGTATQFAGLTVGGQGLLVGRYQASTNPDGTQTFSFTGTLTTADDVLYFDFTITAESEIVLRSYSYAGGTNGNGQQIPAGGFDPILSLFNAAGDLIASNDDGDSVPTDPATGNAYDVFLESLLPAGSYRVAVTAYSNFPVGDNLSEGWQGGGDFDGRTANFAFDVSGADTVTQPGDETPITVIGFGRMQNADGSFTSGADFFQQVDFGIDGGVQYAEGSTFNGFAIGQAIPAPSGPSVPPATTGSDAVLGGVAVIEAAGDAEPDDSDGSGISVNTSSGLINTGSGSVDELLDEAVTSGGDTSQWIDDECLPEDDQQQCKEGRN